MSANKLTHHHYHLETYLQARKQSVANKHSNPNI
jgi:hypothetical protein